MSALPVPIAETIEEHEHTDATRLELLNAIEQDYRNFQNETRRQMELYSKALSMLTGDMYKEVYHRLVGEDCIGLASDYIFNGWHSARYNACEQVKNGLADMHYAFFQAKAYCKVLQKQDGGVS